MSTQVAQSVEEGGRPAAPKLVLILLTLAFAFNFADRTIINTVGEAIKHDLRLSDTQMGLLGGLSFAFLYAFMGIVIARFADRANRTRILAAAIAFWSFATVMCGTASNYITLLLMRVGVGVGEAGCSPTAQSLITDYYPPEKRASAISIFYLGIPLGTIVTAVGTGYIVEHWGWRPAFFIIGAPGILLALAVLFFIKEPPRGRFDAPDRQSSVPKNLFGVIKFMWREPGLKYIAFGVMFAGMSGYSFGQFYHPLLVRHFDLGYAEAAAIYGVSSVVSYGIGSPLGGYLVELFGRRDHRWQCWIPALGALISVPLHIWGLLVDSWQVMVALFILSGIAGNVYHGPAFAAVHNLTSASVRATTTSLIIFLSAFVGLGTGPLLTGMASDFFATAFYSGAGSFATACGQAVASEGAGIAARCAEASSAGLRYALIGASLISLLTALCFFAAGRRFGQTQRSASTT